MKALATLDWLGMVIIRIQRPSRRRVLTALKLWEPPDTCITARSADVQRQVVDLQLHDPRDLAVPLRAAPDHGLGPHGVFAQFVDGGMVVAGDLIGQGQVGGVEDAGLAPHPPQQPRRLLHAQAREGPFAQRAVQQQHARRRLARPQPRRRGRRQIGRIERRKMVGVGQAAKAAHPATGALTRRPSASITTSPSSLVKGFSPSWGSRSSTASDGRHSFTPRGETTMGRFIRIG
ncbi:hypothetical protein LTR94_022769 [Friedmanniomyces endolithicus]|nr:hypothetical protein LTR94_022769 [Friedmanniomyces endolithicus]